MLNLSIRIPNAIVAAAPEAFERNPSAPPVMIEVKEEIHCKTPEIKVRTMTNILAGYVFFPIKIISLAELSIFKILVK